MSSVRRIQSSRANGAKSHGPVTPAGREKSSRNNLRHGLLAECVVLEDEKTQVFDDILADLTREFNPQTETQLGLVETMAAARWRLFRIWNFERETLLTEIEKHEPGIRHESRPAQAFRTLAEQSNILDTLHRYEVRFDRQYARSLNLLLKLASPDSPLAHFCQTNLVPESDTPGAVSPEPTDDPSPDDPASFIDAGAGMDTPAEPPGPAEIIEPAAANSTTVVDEYLAPCAKSSDAETPSNCRVARFSAPRPQRTPCRKRLPGASRRALPSRPVAARARIQPRRPFASSRGNRVRALPRQALSCRLALCQTRGNQPWGLVHLIAYRSRLQVNR